MDQRGKTKRSKGRFWTTTESQCTRYLLEWPSSPASVFSGVARQLFFQTSGTPLEQGQHMIVGAARVGLQRKVLRLNDAQKPELAFGLCVCFCGGRGGTLLFLFLFEYPKQQHAVQENGGSLQQETHVQVFKALLPPKAQVRSQNHHFVSCCSNHQTKSHLNPVAPSDPFGRKKTGTTAFRC